MMEGNVAFDWSFMLFCHCQPSMTSEADLASVAEFRTPQDQRELRPG